MALALTTGKRDLVIDPPWMNAAGVLGFTDESRDLVSLERLGAFVTDPLSLRPRTPAQGRRVLPFPGGFLLHTGHPNPGLSEALRRYRRRWAALPVPVIVHLLATTASETEEMVRRLEGVEGVTGVELGVEAEQPREVQALVRSAAAGELPVLARLPQERPPEVWLAAAEAGAAALVLGPPRGALPTPEGAAVEGRLYGPAVFPQALQAVRRLAPMLPCPLFASGGIYGPEEVNALAAAGAAAVQLDAVLWTEPESVLEGPPPG